MSVSSPVSEVCADDRRIDATAKRLWTWDPDDPGIQLAALPAKPTTRLRTKR
jgi:hypothetical protein